MILTPNERKYLLDSMRKLLSEYNYEYTDEALNQIIDEWSDQKKKLISAFRRHPNYVDGKFMIAFSHSYTRLKDKDAIKRFSAWLDWSAISFVDVPQEILDRREPYCTWLPNKLYEFLVRLQNYSDPHISSETAQMLREVIPEVKPRAGQKTSRVVNKICSYLGYDKISDYNKEFAKYADALNPITIERRAILSINPLDYLTMSFGNSWSSCHTIDKGNLRGMPNGYLGQYSSGTISYMLDYSSMVLYTVDPSYDGDEYWNQPKINRQMFHYEEDKLVQGRLYPQVNDSGSELIYEQYRCAVQGIMSTIFDFPNLWTFQNGTSIAYRYITSNGTNYPDYFHFNNCTISKIKGNENENKLIIGSRPICVSCGQRHWDTANINCCGNGNLICAKCGCVISEDDAFYVGDECYCRDCVYICDDCDEFTTETFEVYDDYGERYVCETCRDLYYRFCEDCENYVHEDLGTYVESVDRWVCDDCLSEYFYFCKECGTYHLKGTCYVHNDNPVCKDCYNRLNNTNTESAEN